MPTTANLADLFAQLWQRLAGDVENFERVLTNQSTRRDEVLASATHLDQVLEEHNAQAFATLTDWLAGRGPAMASSELERVILVAQAIDRWYAPLFPLSRSSRGRNDVALARARRTLLDLGRLNDNGSVGYVIPKRPQWGRWSDPDLELPDSAMTVWDSFKSLMLAPREILASDPDDSAKQRTIKFSYRLLDPARLRDVQPGWIPVVGFAPIAEATEDISIQVRQQEMKHWYDAEAQNLGTRAAAAIEALCKAGAHIIVFPEMVVHPLALAAIQRAIADHGPLSDLLIVLAGTSRQPLPGRRPLNEAVLFNHRGVEIGRQQKLHRWNLSRDLRERYGLQADGLDDSAYLFEFITPGEEIVVIEQTQLGRLAVMICEDLGRSEPGQWLRENILLDWLFTPILDSSILPRRWMWERGTRAAFGGRCRVIVANSFSLTHRQNGENEKASKASVIDVCGIGLCIDVEKGEPRYRLEHLPLAGAPGQISTVRWDPSNWPSHAS